MSRRSIASAAGALAAGYAITVGLFWALLNVPESSVPALTLSAALTVCVVAAAGLTTGTAAALVDGAPWQETFRRALKALPGFIGGLLIFAFLWWITGSADAWWHEHMGQVDAIVLRHVGTARTRWIHETVFLAIWLVRWVVGLAIVAGLVAACSIGGSRAAARGLRTAVRIAPLMATAIAALIVGKGLWRLVDWRPKALPPNWLELVFVAIKLSALYLLAIVLAAIVLAAFQRAISAHVLPVRS